MATRGLVLDELIWNIKINPPGLTLLLYSALTLVFCSVLIQYLEGKQNKVVNIIINLIGYLGKHSLYIFLYHILILRYYLPLLTISNQSIKIVVYIMAMVSLPVMGSSFYNYIKKCTE